MKYFKYDIGSLSSAIKAKDQKAAAVEALRDYLDYMPYADGSYISEIYTKQITKKEYDEFNN